MEFPLAAIIVLMELIGAAEGTPTQVLFKKVYDCIVDAIPSSDFMTEDVYQNDYLVNVSKQWDALNPRDYLYWHKYEGPEAWKAGCHFSDTIRRCLEPLMELKIDLKDYRWKEEHKRVSVITHSLYYVTLCEHQTVLADNAVCIHNRILSDDVLRCSGVYGWRRGNGILIINKHFYKGLNYIYVCIPACIITF